MDRSSYTKGELTEASLLPNPLKMLAAWLEDARHETESTAMCLSTVSADGWPNGRMVLCRGIDEHGIVFYTNYDSQKGHEIEATHRAAATFWWGYLERQVRLQGELTRVSAAESDAYFLSRPIESQLASTISPQSQVIGSREELEELMAKAMPGPRPENWGGYRLVPRWVEFWQGRPARLHDRLRYVREDDAWRVERLAP
ncbi:MAG: pyridoxamine 5'-phosphate oxidase [Chthonomonas sp.]|nr:pyridoxamine 5'-phosphate oxidase [Chthonomonas sp.]